MKWEGKEVSSLDDEALKAAYINLAEMDNFRYSKIIGNSTKFNKKFKNQPEPKVNPIFLELLKEMEDELNKRKLNYAS